MAGCNDRRFEEMLYAYELGMLSDDDRMAVEMHLMECEHCFKRAQQFREAARLIQVDPVVKDSIRRLDSDNPEAEGEILPNLPIPAAKPKILSPWLKTALAAAAILLIMILRPWKIEIGPKQEAVAAENLLAVMLFNNLPHPEDHQKLGEIITNLLITDLSESQYFRVISSQRLYDLLKLQGDDRIKSIDQRSALEIAGKAHARWILTGNILQTEPVYIATTQLIEVSSGNIINARKISGDSGMTIFILADSLSAKIRSDLPLSTKPVEVEQYRPVADVTTYSQEAFRYYLEGKDYYYRQFYAEAIISFEKALEYDSTFAMVYYYLASLKDYTLIAKAIEYSDKTTQRERYYIEGLQAQGSGNISLAISIYQKLVDHYPQEKQAYYIMASLKFNLEKYDEAIGLLGNVIALDPLYGNAYKLLSYSYGRSGNFEKALEMNDKFIFLEPNEPNPYDCRGDIFVEFKMYDKAIEFYKKALEKKSDFYTSWRNLGTAYTFMGDFIKAESCFLIIAAAEDIYIWTDGKIYLAQNLIYQGKYRKALAVLVEGSSEDKKAHGNEIYSTYHHLPALIYEKLGDFNSALDEINKAQEIAGRVYPQEKIYWRRYYARIMAEAGDTASARNIAMELKNSLKDANRKMGDYWYALGAIERATGNLIDAEANFKKATAETDEFDYSAHYMLGRTLLDLNRPDTAIEQFNLLLDDQISHPENWSSWEADTYYYLGVAYQKSGQPREAIQNLTKYLNIMANADPQILSVIDARARLAELISDTSP